jgi:hypothetical protein
MYDYGVVKINKVSSTVISIDDICSCLVTLLCKEEDEKIILRNYLTGQSIGIAGCGQLCHLGDDGSIILPTSCSYYLFIIFFPLTTKIDDLRPVALPTSSTSYSTKSCT